MNTGIGSSTDIADDPVIMISDTQTEVTRVGMVSSATTAAHD